MKEERKRCGREWKGKVWKEWPGKLVGGKGTVC